jgi:hypothetical protein
LEFHGSKLRLLPIGERFIKINIKENKKRMSNWLLSFDFQLKLSGNMPAEQEVKVLMVLVMT